MENHIEKKMEWPEFFDGPDFNTGNAPSWNKAKWPTDEGDYLRPIREVFYNNGNTVDWDHIAKLASFSTRDGVLYMCGLNPEFHNEGIPLGAAMHRREDLAQTFFQEVSKILRHAQSTGRQVWTAVELASWAVAAGYPVHSRFHSFADNATVTVTPPAPPDTVPRTRIGRLALRVAKEIGARKNRVATVKEVMNELYAVHLAGTEADIIERMDKNALRIVWYLDDGGTKTFDSEACKKLLDRHYYIERPVMPKSSGAD